MYPHDSGYIATSPRALHTVKRGLSPINAFQMLGFWR